MPKKLLVFSTQLMETGGLESHIKEFCYNMHRNDIKIDLVVLNENLLPETVKFYHEICENVYFAKNGRSLFRIFWLFITALKIRFRNHQVFYSNGQGDSIKLLYQLLGFKGIWVHHHHTSGDALDQKTWTKSYKWILSNATNVIACSKLNAKNMAAELKRNINTIPCFSRQLNPVKDSKIPTVIKLGYYGRLIREKGIDLLCRLSNDSEMENLEIHIWGEGSAYPASFFKKFPKVYYHGTFNTLEDLNEVVTLIDGFLLLSEHPEGLPISLLEMMSAGVPWLATNKGGIADIVCDPLSTRIIEDVSDYKKVQTAVKNFVDDIRNGIISRTKQVDLYEKRFSAASLVNEWKMGLNLI